MNKDIQLDQSLSFIINHSSVIGIHLTFAGLELGGHREEPLVLDVEFRVELGEDEDLGAPVLGVRRPVLQAEEAEAGGRKGQ